MDKKNVTASIDRCLCKARQGNPQALDAAISCSYDHVSQLVQQQLRRFPTVARCWSADDVLHDVYLQLIEQVRCRRPASAGELLRWASRLIRHQLIDKLRQIIGRRGEVRLDHEKPARPELESLDAALENGADPSTTRYDPVVLQQWTEFHAAAAQLPLELKQVYQLLYYGGLTQRQCAARVRVSERTVRTRWKAARRQLELKTVNR